MASPAELLQQNRKWSEGIRAQNPDFFKNLAKAQTPKYFWIGCADSREPANQILGVEPGAVFVHRNVSNLVLHSDMNCLAALEFAVAVLKVEHVLIVGHYGCGGVGAALHGTRIGLIDNWLRPIGDTLEHHRKLIDATPAAGRHNRLCELNVLEQVGNACHTTIVRDAWDRGQKLAVHGWCYGLADGLLQDLGMDVDRFEALDAGYHHALDKLAAAA